MVKAIGEAAFRDMAVRARRLGYASLRALAPMVILAPHQDDETLGCGGLIARACAMGLRPRVAYLTDGGASHAGSPTWSPRRLARRRRREALEALGILGVPSADTLFLGWPDASPYRPGSAGYAATAITLRAWMESFDARSLWSPWQGEAHCDHLAAAKLAADVAAQTVIPVVHMDYLVWGWAEASLASAHGADAVWALDCPQTIAKRRRALTCHRTQTSPMIADARSAFQIPLEVAALTDRPLEVFLEHR